MNALTFRTASSFVEANASYPDMVSHLGLGGFYQEDILINIRTFDTYAVIFYAYDYHNNFVQLHIENGNRVVFSYNSGDTIYDVKTEVERKYSYLHFLQYLNPSYLLLLFNSLNGYIFILFTLFFLTYKRFLDDWKLKVS